MLDLTERQIERLVSLVEMRLVELSRDESKKGADYRDLEHCRYTLLHMAGARRRRTTLSQTLPAKPPLAAQLWPLNGGKS